MFRDVEPRSATERAPSPLHRRRSEKSERHRVWSAGDDSATNAERGLGLVSPAGPDPGAQGGRGALRRGNHGVSRYPRPELRGEQARPRAPRTTSGDTSTLDRYGCHRGSTRRRCRGRHRTVDTRGIAGAGAADSGAEEAPVRGGSGCGRRAARRILARRRAWASASGRPRWPFSPTTCPPTAVRAWSQRCCRQAMNRPGFDGGSSCE